MMPAVLSFGIALALSLLLVPLVRWLSLQLGTVAAPREDRWHQRPTAVLGGIAIFLAFLFSLLAVSLLNGEAAPLRWGFLIGSAMMFFLGLYDDLKRLTPQAKLVGQILAATVVVAMGFTTNFFTPRIPNDVVAQLPNQLLTFAWLIGITNAINLLDNMDGLAGGIGLITAGFLGFLFWDTGNQGLMLVALALAGSSLGFLVFNFPPASIFMGDSGSLFLGFTLAVLAIARQPQASNVFAVLGVPTLLFLLPILDTVLVTFTRLLRGQSPAQGGRDHTSHRLIAFGLTERQAVLTLYGVALFSGVLAAALEEITYWFSLVLVPAAVISLALLTAYLGGLKVVAGAGAAGRETAFTRIMLALTFKRRLLEVILDFFLIGITFYLAFLTRYGRAMSMVTLELFLQALPVALAGAYLSFFTFGVYRGVWRYVGVDDLVRFLKAALGSVALAVAGIYLLYADEGYSIETGLLFGVYLFLGLAASRSSFRVLALFSGNRARARAAEEQVLICGAGDAGEMALRWILMNPDLDYRPVGFLDHDPFMAGRHIHGVEVLGGPDQLEKLLERKQIDGVILAGVANGDGRLEGQVIETCHRHGCWVRSLRLEFELLE